MGLADEMPAIADRAATFLKGLANPDRLLILCALAEHESSVGDLIETTGIGPTSMSQHLAKLKAEKIVGFRREHRTLFYFIDNSTARDVMQVLYKRFCKEGRKS